MKTDCSADTAASSDLQISVWLRELSKECDEEFLINGTTNGFDIIKSDVTLKSVLIQNHKSALAPETKPEMEKTILNELAEGNCVISSKPPTIISALVAVHTTDT